MKRTFGSLLVRTLRGGTRLSEGEFTLLQALVDELPPHLRAVVDSQFNKYNLVQREHDRRALNFYLVSLFSKQPLQVSPLLSGRTLHAPLLRVSALAGPDPEPLFAVLTAVNGRAFSVSFSRPVPNVASEYKMTVTHVTHAWKSNFPAPAVPQ